MLWHPTRNLFQSRTGSTGHLALIDVPGYNEVDEVSIPNGLHRPFSLSRRRATASPAWQFQSRTGSTGHLALFSYSWLNRANWVSSVMTLCVREEHENGFRPLALFVLWSAPDPPGTGGVE